MMFSYRTDWQFGSNRIGQVLKALQEQNISLYDLTCSNPTKTNISYIDNHLLAELADPQNCTYEPESQGLLRARQAVVKYYEEHGVDILAADIVITSSTSEAYSFLFHLLMNEGDEACFPRPSYPLFEMLSGINDVGWKTYSLIYGNGEWRLDRDSFCGCMNGNTKAVVVVNPNNPTGSFLSLEDVDFLYDICRKSQAAVICDEVFLDYPLEEEYMPVSLAGRQDHLTFVLGGLSKTLGLPQMKLSWIVVSGPEEQKREAVKRLEMISDIFLSVNTPVQNALGSWLAHRRSIQDAIKKRLRMNYQFLFNEKFNHIERLNTQAGWGAILKLPVKIDEEQFCLDLLEKDHVYVHPGYFFDFETGPMIVVSLLPEESVFQSGIQKIAERVSSG